MGSCVSSPLKASPFRKRPIRRKSYGSNTSTVPRYDSPTNLSRKSIFRPPNRVLPDPVADDILLKYEIGRELGRGEFGVTHECIELETRERYACKRISKEKLRTEIDVEDVRREVEIMMHLPKHPNIVSFKEAFEDRDAVYLVMELCEGGELFDRIVSRGHYTERAAASVARTILEIVKVCHEHGVIHRDLKPENFLFANGSESAQLKAIDFGLSIFFKPGQVFGEIVGSPYYMAPEVLRRNYGPEIDVWSAGVILYILLCGVPPFWAETEEGIAQAIVKGSIDFERDPWSKVSEEAKELVRNMLDPNPYSRLTVREVLEHPWIRNAQKAPNVNLGDNVRTKIQQFMLMNKFKKKVLRIVADNLPNEEIEGIVKMFQMMDTDKNGNLTFEELRDGLRKVGEGVPDSDVKMLMDAADTDGDGMLSCEEFVTVSIHMKRIGGDDHLRQAFRYFDQNNNGFIELDELKEALFDVKLGHTNDQWVKDIFFDVDLNKDGRISFEEFKAMMKTGTDWKMASRQYSRALLNALSIKMFKESRADVGDSGQKSYSMEFPLAKKKAKLLEAPKNKSMELAVSKAYKPSGLRN
ncbi:PREDICTED: calcium-dependent protein kinase 24-like [Tarenaya hassleriana]|uniref:calcium-dependent protein kinase 24-like n=1 Tax=Tarenaya hassleriana TaxID=28532 RepID=UPI00053C20C8|nr:PREDICTED: calcium-dependent protein kinase 24-like [Tarenaya hassleriana]